MGASPSTHSPVSRFDLKKEKYRRRVLRAKRGEDTSIKATHIGARILRTYYGSRGGLDIEQGSGDDSSDLRTLHRRTYPRHGKQFAVSAARHSRVDPSAAFAASVGGGRRASESSAYVAASVPSQVGERRASEPSVNYSGIYSRSVMFRDKDEFSVGSGNGGHSNDAIPVARAMSDRTVGRQGIQSQGMSSAPRPQARAWTGSPPVSATTDSGAGEYFGDLPHVPSMYASWVAGQQYCNGSYTSGGPSRCSPDSAADGAPSFGSRGLSQHQALVLLGINCASPSRDEIRRAYKKAALRWHPDRQCNHGDLSNSTDMFTQVSAAYDLLLKVGPHQ